MRVSENVKGKLPNKELGLVLEMPSVNVLPASRATRAELSCPLRLHEGQDCPACLLGLWNLHKLGSALPSVELSGLDSSVSRRCFRATAIGATGDDWEQKP